MPVPTIDPKEVKGARFINPPLIKTNTGSVEDFDPKEIAAAQKEVEERVPFCEKHCKSLGENPCAVCKSPACPIADQG